MRLAELIGVLDENKDVIVNDTDGERVARYDGKNGIDERFDDLDVKKVSMCIQVDEPVFIVEVEIPTFVVTGTIQVEVEATVKALCEDDAYDELDGINVGVHNMRVNIDDSYAEGVDVQSVDVTDIDWDDMEKVRKECDYV